MYGFTTRANAILCRLSTLELYNIPSRIQSRNEACTKPNSVYFDVLKIMTYSPAADLLPVAISVQQAVSY